MWELYDTECHKQHINLSNQAHDIIFMDMLNFMGERNVSGFVNRLIVNFSDESEASYVEMLGKKQGELEAALSDIPENGTKKAIIDRLVDDYRKTIDMKIAGYPGGDSISIRLSNDNYERFFMRYCPTGEFYTRQGQYFKALLEEYAGLPQEMREAVFFRDTVESLNSAIIQKTLVKYALANGKDYEMRPISVSADSRTRWNYLLGYSRPYQSQLDWRLVSVRVSRIVRISEIRSRTGKVTKDELRSAQKRLISSGLAYIQDEPEEITIRLTDRGMQRLEMTIHLRPYFEKTAEKNVITLICTQMQALDYFCRFIGEIEVISPASFKEKLSSRMKAVCDNSI